MGDPKKDVIEKSLDSVSNATKAGLDTLTDFIGGLMGANSNPEPKPEITVTKNPDGSTDVHIPKDQK